MLGHKSDQSVTEGGLEPSTWSHQDGASGGKSSAFFLFPVFFFLLTHTSVALAGFADTPKAKALRWMGVINIPVDGEGKQNELVCDGSSQPRDTKTRIAGLTKYP